jgi:predicted dehydrogenase
MLDMREKTCFLRARKFIQSGRLGKVTQIHFGGQHPLLLGSRPGWYFEAGKQGGTINDIAIHGIDMITFLTGDTIAETLAAREWQAFYTRDDNFRDAAQFMLETSSGCGVIGDVSYAAPDSQGYTNPLYWRFTIWGTAGVLDITSTKELVMAYLNSDDKGFAVEESVDPLPDCLDSFLADIAGTPADLNTSSVLAVSRSTLQIQQQAVN